MTDTFRALCAELLEAIAPYQLLDNLNAEARIRTADRLNSVVYRAKTALEKEQALVPVPVSERPWEREGWCDAEGNCWLGSNALDGCTPTWFYGPPAWAERFPNFHRVLLPAHALPLPEVGE